MFIVILCAVVLLIVGCVWLKRLNGDYHILALCRRIKTVDGSKLKDKVWILPGNSPFGNNFDMIDMNSPEKIFETFRAWKSCAKGKSYVFYMISSPNYNITTAEDAEEIFQSPDILEKGVTYQLLQPFIGEGLLLSSDKKWHFRRKILTPAFHFNILQTFLDIFKEETDKLINRLNRNVEQIITLNKIIPRFTLNAICETALGVKLDDVDGSDEYRNAVRQIEEIIVARSINPLMYFPIIFYLFGDYKNNSKYLKIAHDFSSKIIEKRREAFVKSQRESKNFSDDFGKKRRYAMLDTLLDTEIKGQIDHQGICDEVNTFMFEGFDTTSACLMFTLLNLASDSVIQDKCYEEISSLAKLSQLSIFDYNKLEYLECVIKETLRMYPSVPVIARYCSKDTIINGLRLPESTDINIHIYDIMRDPKHFPNPDQFNPDRFSPENSIDRHPFAFVPFSAGSRNCIGQKFAMLEVKVLLVEILRNYRLSPETRLEDLSLGSMLILRTKGNMEVRIDKRS